MSLGRFLQMIGLIVVAWGFFFSWILHDQPRAEWIELGALLAGVLVFIVGVKLDRRQA